MIWAVLTLAANVAIERRSSEGPSIEQIRWDCPCGAGVQADHLLSHRMVPAVEHLTDPLAFGEDCVRFCVRDWQETHRR